MTARVAGVRSSILKWARESQGYSIAEVARRLKRDPAEIEGWEAGKGAPTYVQLETLAYEIYKRPLAVFFLPAAPTESTPEKEFRTLPDSDLENLAADTRYQIRLAHALQLSLKELNEGINPAERIIFRDLRLSAEKDVKDQAKAVRGHLGITLDTQTSWPVPEIALKAWRQAVEEVGVYVFKHAFKQNAISGFCLLDGEFPLIYLNNSTSKTRQIFSLFHELAHLLVHVNGISKFDTSYISHLQPRERHIEIFCNAFAAELLIPSDDFTQQIQELRRVEYRSVQRLASRYSVSREAIMRRLLDRGLVTNAVYEEKAAEWSAEADKEVGGKGGNYFATQATYLGERYLQLVLGKHYQGKLTLEQVAEHLGVKTKSIAGLEELALHKAVLA